jgi:hypothetical protein
VARQWRFDRRGRAGARFTARESGAGAERRWLKGTDYQRAARPRSSDSKPTGERTAALTKALRADIERGHPVLLARYDEVIDAWRDAVKATGAMFVEINNG